MTGQVLGQVLAHRDRTHAGAAAPVRDAERLVQIEVADVAAEPAGPGQPDQGVEVGAVDVHLAADVVHRRADLGDVVLVDAVRRRVGDHQRRQPIRVLGHFRAQVVEVDVAVGAARHHHDPHAGQCRRRRVGAVGAGRDQAHVAVGLAALGVIRLDRQQTGVLPLRTRVRLQRHRVIPGDRGQPGLEVGDQLAQPRRVRRRRERMLAGELGPGDRLHLGGRIELHRARAERNHAAVQRNILVGQRPQVAHHLGFGAILRERRMGEELRGAGSDVRAVEVSAERRTVVRCRHQSGSEGLEHGRHVLVGGGLVARHRHVVGVDAPQVDALGLGRRDHASARPGTRASTVSKNRGVHHLDAGPRAARRPAPRARPCTRRAIPARPVGTVIAGVHGGDHRQQHLRGADIAGGLVAADVLLAGLQRQPVGRRRRRRLRTRRPAGRAAGGHAWRAPRGSPRAVRRIPLAHRNVGCCRTRRRHRCRRAGRSASAPADRRRPRPARRARARRPPTRSSRPPHRWRRAAA